MSFEYSTQKQYNATYQQQKAAYEQKLAAWKAAHQISGDTVTSAEINQQLKTGTESSAALTISGITGGHIANNHDSHDTRIGDGIYLIFNNGYSSFDVTYTNLTNTSYNNRPITKLTYHVTVSPNVTTKAGNVYSNKDAAKGDSGSDVFSMLFSRDPTRGFDLWGVKANITATYYYSDGTPVNFESNTAFLSVGSLNNYTNVLKGLDGNPHGYSIEATAVNFGGRAVGLAGSSVTAHGGTILYSDLPNSEVKSKLPSYILPNPSGYDYDGHYGDWDRNGSGLQYVGAGLIELTGSSVNFTAETLDTGIPSNANYRNWMWWNATSVIPKTPGFQETPPTPKYSSINYHYDVF